VERVMSVGQLNECFWRASSAITAGDDLVVGSAITGYYKPNDCANPAVVDGATYRYRAESDDLSQVQSGEAPYDVATSTLKLSDGSARIFQSSNSGSAVTFSAAPKVMMTSAVQDVVSGRWELIEETVITSTSGQFEHAIPNPGDYWQFAVDASNCTVTSPGNTLLGSVVDSSVTVDASNIEDLPAVFIGANTPPGGGFAQISTDLAIGYAYSTSDGAAKSLGGSPPLTSLKIVFSGFATDEFSVVSIVDVESVTVRTFGLRK
jgi:hypothetical protein